MTEFIPPIPAKSVRIILELNRAENRLDTVLLAAIKSQGRGSFTLSNAIRFAVFAKRSKIDFV